MRLNVYPMAISGLLLASLLSFDAGAQSADQTVSIKGGEKVRVAVSGKPDFFLRFAAVVSDERCPARVKCAWANPPVVAIEASAQGKPAQSFEISPGGPGGVRRGNYLGVMIEYVDLTPAPQEPGEFAKVRPLAIYTVVLKIGGPEEKPR